MSFVQVICVVSIFLSASPARAQSRSWASNDSVEASQELHADAVEAVIWGMPIVAMDAMRQAYFRDAIHHAFTGR